MSLTSPRPWFHAVTKASGDGGGLLKPDFGLSGSIRQSQLTSPEGTYSATKVAGKSVPMSLTFSDATHGTLTMGNVTIPIVRFQEF